MSELFYQCKIALKISLNVLLIKTGKHVVAFLENMNFDMYVLKCQSITIMVVIFQEKASQGEHSNKNYGNPTHMQSCVKFFCIFRCSVQCKNSLVIFHSKQTLFKGNLKLNNYMILYSIKSFELCN